MNAEGKKKAKGGKGGVQLFQPMTLRGVTMRNRIWLPPMDTYSAVARDGKPTPFHYQHYVSRAMGGFGMIIAEATAVTADGRISPRDVGLWNDDQVAAWHWIVDGIKQAGAVAAVQLNHAGRKGSTGCFGVGFEGKSVPEDAGGWRTVAPSPIAYRDAAQRAVRAGFEAIEIHAAHGYLISQFLDPLCNERADEYGGDIHGRMRFLLEVADAIREVIPDTVPLLVRISATDWAAGGWDLDQTVDTACVLKQHGVDLMDVSTGGIIADVSIPVKANYQVPFSDQVRERAAIPTTTVGLITKPKQAEKILRAVYGCVDQASMPTASLMCSKPSRLRSAARPRLSTVICCGPRYISALMNMTRLAPLRILRYACCGVNTPPMPAMAKRSPYSR